MSLDEIFIQPENKWVSSPRTWDAVVEYANNFHFNTNKPPLFPIEQVAACLVGYLVSIKLGTWWMSKREPIKLKVFAAYHNFFLFALSIIMAVGITRELLVGYFAHDAFTLFCDADRKFRTGPLYFWFYIFLWSKVYEFLDTFIQVLNKRTPPFLHVWHHCTTLLLVWVCLTLEMSIQWLSILFNCVVHIAMYYYYWQASLGNQVWWKKYLTGFQITQFVITNVVNGWWIYGYYNYGCSGTPFGFYFGQFVLNSFLILFLQFYMSSYKKQGASKKTN